MLICIISCFPGDHLLYVSSTHIKSKYVYNTNHPISKKLSKISMIWKWSILCFASKVVAHSGVNQTFWIIKKYLSCFFFNFLFTKLKVMLMCVFYFERCLFKKTKWMKYINRKWKVFTLRFQPSRIFFKHVFFLYIVNIRTWQHLIT